MAINKKQIKHLKALAHDKKPIVIIGNNGVTDTVIAEIKIALDHHELIKIKLPAVEKQNRLATIKGVCDQCGANFVSMIGRVAIIFLPAPKSSINFPV